MSTNDSRSMNAELSTGRVEGSIRTIAPDRGGEIDAGTLNARQHLHEDYGYGPMRRSMLEIMKENHLLGDEAIPR